MRHFMRATVALPVALLLANIGASVKVTLPLPVTGGTVERQQAVIKAAQCSRSALASLMALKDFRGIQIVPQNDAIRNGVVRRGWVKDHVIYVTDDLIEDYRKPIESFHTVDYSRNNPNDLAFAVGFLSSLVVDENERRDSMERVVKEAAAGKDLTQVIIQSRKSFIESDSRAFLRGWNAVMECDGRREGKIEVDRSRFKDLLEMQLKMRFLSYFHSAMGNHIVIHADGFIPLDSENVRKFAEVLGNLSPIELGQTG